MTGKEFSRDCLQAIRSYCPVDPEWRPTREMEDRPPFGKRERRLEELKQHWRKAAVA